MPNLIGPRPLTDEQYREYDLNGRVYRIDNPVSLYYREGGSTHRIVDAAGVVHCVPFPMVSIEQVHVPVVLRWKPKDAAVPVAF